MPPSPITGSAMKAQTSPREAEARRLGHAPRAGHVAALDLEVERAAVAVRRRGEGHAGHVGAAALLAARVAGDAERREGAAVEAGLESHELALAGVALGEPHGAFDGLGARVGEEGLLQAPGVISRQQLGEVGGGLHVVDVGAGVHQLVGLRLGGLDDPAVAVTGVGDADAGEAVDVLGAVGVVEQSSVAVVGDDRLDPLHEPGHDELAVLLFHTHVIDHPSATTRVDNGQERGAAEAYQTGETAKP